MKERKVMFVVDDLGLHPATDRATYRAAGGGAVTGADLMMNQPRTKTALREMQDYPDVSIGVHINIFPGSAIRANTPDAVVFRRNPSERMGLLIAQSKDQIKRYQDETGKNPDHISTHNHTHLDMDGNVFPQFVDAVLDVVGEGNTVVRGQDTDQIRHCRVATLSKGIPPLSPEAFENLLRTSPDNGRPLELLVHPGLPPEKGEVPLDDEYSLDLRVFDLHAVEAYKANQTVTKAGFRFVTPKEVIIDRA